MGERREAIVTAALDLLAEVPVERLTTRAVADRVGVSQPALFRHFTSRNEILGAVVGQVTESLRAEVARILAAGAEPEAATRELARSVFSLSRRHPGIPALFLHDTARGGSGACGGALDHLAALPVAFVAELVRTAARDGSLRPIDADVAARLLVAMIQGVLLQARREARLPEPDRDAALVTGFWWAALRAGQPPSAAADPPGRPAAEATAGLRSLDVRPIIARGEDPLDTILETIDGLRADGALVLTAPFRPEPLLALLTGRGWTPHERDLVDGGEGRVVEFTGRSCPAPVDLTQLEAPEPMTRVLERVERLGPGEPALFRLPRRPEPLLALLAQRAVSVELATAPDGVTLLLARPAPGAAP